MMTRKQVAAADARDQLGDIWARFEVIEADLKGHGIEGGAFALSLTCVHASMRVLGELLKNEMEKSSDELR